MPGSTSLKPLTLAVLALYWIVTGLVALGPGWEDGTGLIQEAGFAIAAPLAAAERHRRHRDRRRHRRQAHRKARAPGRPGAVARLRRAWHAAAAGAVGRPARAPAEGPAHHGAQPGGAGDPGRPLMTAYLALKYLHVIGAAVLLGTGAGIAFFMLLAHRTGEARGRGRRGPHRRHRRLRVHRHRRRGAADHRACCWPGTSATRCATAGSCCRSCSISSPAPSGCPWCGCRCACAISPPPPRARASRCRAEYHRLFRLWFAFGFPAFAAVLAIFWLMIARPRLW